MRARCPKGTGRVWFYRVLTSRGIPFLGIGEFPMAKKEQTPEISGAPSADSNSKTEQTNPPANPATQSGGEKEITLADFPAQETLPIDAEELAAPLAAGMPTPTNADVAPQVAPPTESTPERPEIKDDFGTVFNPDKHRADAFGNPIKKNGKFLSTRGRKEGGKNSVPGNEEKSKAEDYVNTSGVPDQFDTAAEMILQTAYGTAAMFLSDEIRPENPEEHITLKVPLAAVLREKGVVQLTPTQLLLFSLAAYAAKKAGKPTVKERAILIYLKAKSFFTGKKQEPKPVN